MHELLRSARPSVPEAVERCRGFLRRRWGPRILLLRLAPRHLHADLVALATWWLVSRELEGGSEARRGLEDLARELDAALGERPTSALGTALGQTVRRRRLPPFLLRSEVAALRAGLEVSAFQTRGELLEHSRKRAQPAARILLRLFGLEGEREEILADALATGVQLAAWLGAVREDWGRGRLRIPIGELTDFGVDLGQIEAGRHDDALRALMARQIEEARVWLAKGWPLTEAVGPLRGRQIAFFLRWHAAGLGAIEAIDFDVLNRRPRSGWLRGLACLAASAVTVRAPEAFPPPGAV